MIHFTGDICLADKAFDVGIGIGSQISKGKLHPFDYLEKNNDDVWIGNFEAVLSNHTCRKGGNTESFRITPETFDKCGSIIDYWGIANNHVMEHGKDAYCQMEEILSQKSKGVFGSQKKRTISFKHCGKQIAMTGFSLRAEENRNEPLYWHLPELAEIRKELEKNTNADFKIAYIHWGVEFVNHPTIEQIRLAHWLIDVGYDLIIGMHPHVLQGYEVYRGKHIFYSLGNTIFNMSYDVSKYGLIVLLDVETETISYKYIHLNSQGSPQYIEESGVPAHLRLTELNNIIGNTLNTEKYIGQFHQGLKAYRKSNNAYIIRNIFNYSPKFLSQMFTGFFKRRF